MVEAQFKTLKQALEYQKMMASLFFDTEVHRLVSGNYKVVCTK